MLYLKSRLGVRESQLEIVSQQDHQDFFWLAVQIRFF